MYRMRRETFNPEKQQPSVHQDSLQKYLQVSKHLVPKANSKLLRSIIRHPDLRPSNIFVSDEFEITSLIDWQNSTVLPVCLQSGIPTDLDNSRGSISRAMQAPTLPPVYTDLSEDDQREQLEVLGKRQLHYFYMTEAANKKSPHFDALIDPFSIARCKIFQLSSAPWQGDNVPLRSSLVFVKQNWHNICASSNTTFYRRGGA